MREIKEWLAKDLNWNSSQINTLYNSDEVISFLLIWNRFESKCFDRKYEGKNVPNFIKRLDLKILSKDKEEIIKYFHIRYQDTKLLDNLMHDDIKNIAVKKHIDKVLSKEYSVMENQEKIEFLIYVIYRYRCNMFHGNKALNSWLKYEEPIKKCIKIMISIMDNYNSEKS